MGLVALDYHRLWCHDWQAPPYLSWGERGSHTGLPSPWSRVWHLAMCGSQSSAGTHASTYCRYQHSPWFQAKQHNYTGRAHSPWSGVYGSGGWYAFCLGAGDLGHRPDMAQSCWVWLDSMHEATFPTLGKKDQRIQGGVQEWPVCISWWKKESYCIHPLPLQWHASRMIVVWYANSCFIISRYLLQSTAI